MRTINLRNQTKQPTEPVVIPPVSEEPLEQIVEIPEIPETSADVASALIPQHERRTVLTGFVALLAVIAAAVWFFQGNSLLALFLLMCAGIFVILPRRSKSSPTIALDSYGISVDGIEYPYARLSSFSIRTDDTGGYELSLATDQWHTPHLIVPLGTQADDVHEALLQYLPEAEHPISASHALTRYLGF